MFTILCLLKKTINAAIECTMTFFYSLKVLQFRLLEDMFIKNNKAGCIYLMKEQCTFLLFILPALLSSVFLFVILFSSILFYLTFN